MALKYSVNDLNQLVVQDLDRSSSSVTLPGSFELTENHSLRYHFNPLPKSLEKLGLGPEITEITFTGEWSLAPDHTLRLHLKDSPEELILRTGFVSTDAYRLVFSVTTQNPATTQSTRLFQFSGTWQADQNNRLTFVLTASDSDRGRLVFEGRWKVGRNYEIVYRYAEEQLKTGKKKTQTLILTGSWKLAEKGYLNYAVEGASDSQFRFRAEFLGHDLLPGELSQLSFRVGIEIIGSAKEIFEIIKITGRLKVRGPLELGFEVTYEEGRVEEIKLLAEYEVVGRNKIDLELFNSQKEGLGIQITVLTKIFKDQADLFLRARATEEEKAVEGGVRLKW